MKKENLTRIENKKIKNRKNSLNLLKEVKANHLTNTKIKNLNIKKVNLSKT